MALNSKLTRFNDAVVSKFTTYSSILSTLPFIQVDKTGSLLPLFHDVCVEGFAKKKNPTQIIEEFMQQYEPKYNEKEQIDLLFRFIQFIERKVVLFDAIEESAFSTINNMSGHGTLQNTREEAEARHKKKSLIAYLNDFKVRVVLTAHPTQFYPQSVLGIIHQLSKAIQKDDILMMRKLLSQLGKTPFFKKSKPTPYDEAIHMMWYLEHVFYPISARIYDYIETNIFDDEPMNNTVIDLGFWPAGDRDGNPFVTPEMTRDVGFKLRELIAKCYYKDVHDLKSKLTFSGVEEKIIWIESELYKIRINDNSSKIKDATQLLRALEEIKEIIVTKHQSLYVDELETLINKVKLFSFYFVSLDIRQDSRVHEAAFNQLIIELPNIFPSDYEKYTEHQKLEFLGTIKADVNPDNIKDENAQKVLKTIKVMQEIQARNGEKACNRHIISNTQSAEHMMQLYAMLQLCNWDNGLNVDLIPLFETVDDLEHAAEIMEKLYQNTAYRKHISERNNKQTIMLGFSDGTKDGGFLMANWAIYRAKEELTSMARKYNIDVLFFDGRGGPPARGGGKTHRFYSSLGNTIENKEVQITIQGQTVSSNFGTLNAAQYNLEQLISAGYQATLFNMNNTLTDDQRRILEDLSNTSYQSYKAFKEHPKFLSYLNEMSPLRFYAKTNIGSRPAKRNGNSELKFSDLRAIPFVGSWSQLKQNVPGFYGVGTAIEKYEKENRLGEIEDLYHDCAFFKALIDNSMMALSKSFLELTAYMKEDPEFGEFWEIINQEFNLTKRLLLQISGLKELMGNDKVGKASIEIREDIVLPLLTIQQYALRKLRAMQTSGVETEYKSTYEKIVTRSMFGNINASRNSA